MGMLFVVACGDDSPPPYAGAASAGDVAAAARMAAEAVNRDSAGGGQGIVVSGTGVASGEPDLALINLGVQVLSPSVGEALDTANGSLESILGVLADHNVDEKRHADALLSTSTRSTTTAATARPQLRATR